MSTSVAVVILLSHPSDHLVDLAHDLDAQTLSADEFHVVFLDQGDDPAWSQRLRRLSGRRPNVAVHAPVPSEDVRPDGAAVAAIKAVEADRVLVLDERYRLLPATLERLGRAAVETGADVVVGRSVTSAGAGGALLAAEPARTTEPGRLGADLSAARAGVALVRRARLIELIERSGDHTEARQEGQPPDGLVDWPSALLSDLLADTDSAVILPGYACARTPSASSDQDEQASVELSPADLRWTEATALIRITGTITDTGGNDLELIPAVVLHQPATGEEFPLVTAGSIDQTSRTGTRSLQLTAEFVPSAGALGDPLPNGVWQVALRLFGPGQDSLIPVPAAAAAASALIAGHPIGIYAGPDGWLCVDMGAVGRSVVDRMSVADTRITEGPHGSELRGDLPGLHVWGDGRLEGYLTINRFAQPGVLIGHDGRAELRCFVGSLRGRYPLGARFGGRVAAGTGLALDFSATGRITATPHVEPATATTTAPATTSTDTAPPRTPRTTSPRPKSRVEKLRRAVPGPLEPAAKAVARLAPARRIYRRLSGR